MHSSYNLPRFRVSDGNSLTLPNAVAALRVAVSHRTLTVGQDGESS
jgi:hypothetical protein